MKKIMSFICIVFILNSCTDNTKVIITEDNKEKTEVNTIINESNIVDNSLVIETKEDYIIDEKKYFYEIEMLGKIVDQIELKINSGLIITDVLITPEEFLYKGEKYVVANLDFYKLEGMNLGPNIYIGTNGLNYQLMLLIDNNGDKIEIIHDTKNIIAKEKSIFNNVSKKLIKKELVQQYIYEQDNKQKEYKNDLLVNANGGNDLRISDLNKINVLLMMYHSDNAEFPNNLEELNKIIPKDPIDGTIIEGCTFGYFYELEDNSDIPRQGFRLSTCLNNNLDNLKTINDGGIYDNKYEITGTGF